jgi:hypothetical protein
MINLETPVLLKVPKYGWVNETLMLLLFRLGKINYKYYILETKNL